MDIKLYTDGACKGNPGPGGYGCILSTVVNGQPFERRHSGGYRLTTNNRMELAAVIFGLSNINGAHNVEVISDSKYVCDAFNKKWIHGWRQKGWHKQGGLPNADMWQTLWNLVTMQNSVKFTWVKGHNNHPQNEECDRMAVAASINSSEWQVDQMYEKSR